MRIIQNPKFYIAILASLSLMFLSSCTGERRILKAPLQELGQDYLFQKMIDSQPDFSTLSLRASIHYRDKK
ncbi:MAG TPA: hypothetical protein PKE52_02725, partial [Bacteroidales bacterium]|nr:hypothetical protein [Bacteroidales bacterium]